MLLLAEAGLVAMTISEQVVVETERAVAQKALAALPFLRETLRATHFRLVPAPSREQVSAHADLIADPADISIVLAAMNAQVDYLVTLNRRHFLDDPGVAAKSGLRIGAPADALTWVRTQLRQA